MSIRIIDDHEVCEQQLRTANKRADKAEADLDRAYERYDKAEQDRNHWHDKAQEYRQEREELRVQVKTIKDGYEKVCKKLQQNATTPSRVTTVDDIRNSEPGSTWESRLNQIWEWTGKELACHLAFGQGMNYGNGMSMQTVMDSVGPFKRSGVAPRGDYPKPDNPWFATVYEDATHWADTWRGTPVRPQSIRTGDLYDIHTAHGSRITGVVAARNGVRNPQNGDHYRLVSRAGGKA